MKKIVSLVYLIITTISLYSQTSEYKISYFSRRIRSFPASENMVIEPISGDNLTEVNSVPWIKSGEVLLRIRFGPLEYRIYHGKFKTSAFDETNKIYIFKIPADLTINDVIHFKFYKEKSSNANNDEALVYFDNGRIYLRFLSGIYYRKDGVWEEIKAENISIKKNKIKPIGTIQVTSKPKGAEIFLDGKDINFQTPNYIEDVFAGKHTIAIKLKNYQEDEKKIIVKVNEITPVDFNLKSSLGTMKINSMPTGAKVFINKSEVGITPLVLTGQKPGQYTVEVEKDLYKPVKDILHVEMNEILKWDAVLAGNYGTLVLPKSNVKKYYKIDGNPVSGNSVKLNPGKHRIEWGGGGRYSSIDTLVQITTGKTVYLAFKPRRLAGGLKGFYKISDREDKRHYEAGTDRFSGHVESEGMVWVQGGEFMMGSNNGQDDEEPMHRVYVNGFYISKYEVTNAEYCEFLNAKGNQTEGIVNWLDIDDTDCKIVKLGIRYISKPGYENHPVTEVTWYGARAYCKWRGGRLPTEAEWEYTVRGGRNSRGYKYSGSNNPDEVAWNSSNSGNKTHAVGRKAANELGIYDMSGNVWEWCSDWYDENYYETSPLSNPKGPSSGKFRILRGGSWRPYISLLRPVNRVKVYPGVSDNDSGFRYILSGR